jgi:hypothetical protein
VENSADESLGIAKIEKPPKRSELCRFHSNERLRVLP